MGSAACRAGGRWCGIRAKRCTCLQSASRARGPRIQSGAPRELCHSALYYKLLLRDQGMTELSRAQS